MTRWIGPTALAAACILAPAVAAAGDFQATRSPKLVESDHTIDVALDHGHATLRVRRTVFNGGPKHDQATFWIDVPGTAVATGLRTLGTWKGQPRWFDGELMEAEAAAEKYRELTGIGGYYPKDPALLSWRSQDTLALQVFPCPPNQRKSVEYTLTVPLEYDEGRYRLHLHELGTAALRAELVLRPVHRGDQVFVDGEPVGSGARFTADQSYEIDLARRGAPRVDDHLAVVSTGERYLVRYEFALARQLSRIPRDAGVVVLIDSSFSIPDGMLEAQLAATKAYLSHFADPSLRARAEVVTFDRRPRAQHGRLTGVGKVLADLEGFTPKAGNGSHVDAALAEAAKLLKRTRKGAKRIVLLTDARTRKALTPTRVAAATRGSGAVVHIGFVDDVANASLERDDLHDWADAARTTGGLLWQAEASTDPADAQSMEAAYLEWARPVRLHHPDVLAPGMPATEIELPDELPEGFGYSTTTLLDTPVRHVILSGELWSKPVHEVARPSREQGRRWSALVFGSELEGDLSEPEMMVLAMHGGAVSPVTSYLAIEPGVRPSTEGLDWGSGSGAGGGMGGGTLGLGSVGLIGRGGGGGFDPQAFLQEQVRDAATKCGVPSSVGVGVELQTTLAEIVEVDSVALTGSRDARLQRCVREGTWAIELPGPFDDEWRRWTVGA